MTPPAPPEPAAPTRQARREEQSWRPPDTVRDVLTVLAAADTPTPSPRLLRPEPAPVDRPPAATVADVVAALPEAVVALDPDGRVRLWNPAAEELFGWPAAEVVGGPPPFLPGDRLAEHRRMLALAAAGGRVRDLDTVRRARGGAAVRVAASAAVDATGGVVLTFRPAAAPPLAEPPPPPDGALARPGNEKQLETLGRLLAAVAHDVNNVLAVVCGNAEYLAQTLPAGSPARESADVIQVAGGHAAELARRLLAFARPAAGGPVPVDVAGVLADLGGLVRAVAGSAVRVVLRPGRGAGPVAADPRQVEQVVLNLVANARDAMPRGGTLGVRAGAVVVRPGRPGWPPHLPAGRYACLTVADTGTGIDDVTRARLFQPFFTTKGPAGTGLGLATVHDTATRLGGHVEVDSDPGLGTVFRVYLPAAAGGTGALAWVPAGTVLLVDDHPGARAAARAALEGGGFDVIEAASGDGAARLARAVPTAIDVLVTDLVLPGLGGRKLAAQLRAERPDLGVVFLSGYKVSANDPAEPFVPKPVRPAELLAAVRRAMRAGAG